MKDKKSSLPQINENIRAPRLQVITKDGENVGEISLSNALAIAEADNLDLVLLTEKGPEGVPIAKIMNFGKVLYERKKKQSEAKKHQKTIQIKEIKIRPKIGEHDYQTKINQAIQFLSSGKRVKISLFFRGRENVSRQERGREIFDKVDKTFEESGLKNLVKERESNMGQSWFCIYYVK
ncbi:MAG: translation initiation factor IF-3 [Candidatus Dependentiae bacterium]